MRLREAARRRQANPRENECYSIDRASDRREPRFELLPARVLGTPDERARLARRCLVSAVVLPERDHRERGEQREQNERCDNREVIQARFRHETPPFRELEPDVLQRLGRVLVEARRERIVPTLRGEVPLRDPGGGPMACR